jgi:hypothetical protein
MHRALAFVGCLSVACSTGIDAPPPASAPSDPFDAEREVFEVPREVCPPLHGWLAMTPRAAVEMMNIQAERKRDCAAKVARAEMGARLADAQRQAAMDELQHAQWWQRWGPFLVLGVAGLGASLGVVMGVTIERYTRR